MGRKFAIVLLGLLLFKQLDAGCEIDSSCYQPRNDCSDEYTHRSQAIVPAGPHTPDEIGPMFYITGAYTLWTAREGALPVAYGRYSPIDEVPRGRISYPQWKLNSGFKVSAGFFIGTDGWELMVQYTWFYNWGNKNAQITWSDLGSTSYQWPVMPQVQLYEHTGLDGFFTPARSLQSIRRHWDIQFNRIDFVWARTFFGGHSLLVRPFAGIMAFWDDQKLHMVAVSNDTTGAGYRGHESQTSWGVGPYAGFGAEFVFYSDCSNQFGFFGSWGLALPWTTFKAKISSKASTSENTQKGNNTHNNRELSTVMMEAIVGLRYVVYCGCSFMFLMEVAWECQVYTDHNHMYSFTAYPQGAGAQDLSFQGLTARIGFGF